MPQNKRCGCVEMYFMYRKHLPHLLRARPESASGENWASNKASMFSIWEKKKGELSDKQIIPSSISKSNHKKPVSSTSMICIDEHPEKWVCGNSNNKTYHNCVVFRTIYWVRLMKISSMVTNPNQTTNLILLRKSSIDSRKFNRSHFLINRINKKITETNKKCHKAWVVANSITEGYHPKIYSIYLASSSKPI